MRPADARTFYRPSPPKMPAGLVELMEGLTKEVLKHSPNDVYGFCAGHMQKLLQARDGAPKTKLPTIEEKIALAQEKVRQRAEKRRQEYDTAFILIPQNNSEEEKIASYVDSELAPSSLLQQNVLMPPVQPDQEIVQSSEIEISRHVSNKVIEEAKQIAQCENLKHTDDAYELKTRGVENKTSNAVKEKYYEEKQVQLEEGSNILQENDIGVPSGTTVETEENQNFGVQVINNNGSILNSHKSKSENPTMIKLTPVDDLHAHLTEKSILNDSITDTAHLPQQEHKYLSEKGDIDVKYETKNENKQKVDEDDTSSMLAENNDETKKVTDEGSMPKQQEEKKHLSEISEVDVKSENENENKQKVDDDDTSSTHAENNDETKKVIDEGSMPKQQEEKKDLSEISEVDVKSENENENKQKVDDDDSSSTLTENNDETKKVIDEGSMPKQQEQQKNLSEISEVDVKSENENENKQKVDEDDTSSRLAENNDETKKVANEVSMPKLQEEQKHLSEIREVAVKSANKNENKQKVNEDYISITFTANNDESKNFTDGGSIKKPQKELKHQSEISKVDTKSEIKRVNVGSLPTQQEEQKHLSAISEVDAKYETKNENKEKVDKDETLAENNDETKKVIDGSSTPMINEEIKQLNDTSGFIGLSKNIINSGDKMSITNTSTVDKDPSKNPAGDVISDYKDKEVVQSEFQPTSINNEIHSSLEIGNDLEIKQDNKENKCKTSEDELKTMHVEPLQVKETAESSDNFFSAPEDGSCNTQFLEPLDSTFNSVQHTTTDASSLVHDSARNDNQDNNVDLETAAITIQKVFRSFLFKSRASTLDDTANDDDHFSEEDSDKKVKTEEDYPIVSSLIKERRPHGITRMDTVLQTVNEEKSLSLSTDDSSTLSSAATIIQAHVRGFLVRNKLNSYKAHSLPASNSHNPSPTSLENDNDHLKNKTILNIHIVPEGNYLSRDESLITSIDLSLDGSPPSSINLHPLGYDKSERRKQLKREDAIQSISPPSNNSGKLSEDVDSVKDLFNDNITAEERAPDDNMAKDIRQLNKITNFVHNDSIETAIQKTNNALDKTLSEMNTSYGNLKQTTMTLSKMSSDEMDVVTPFESNEDNSTKSKLMHSGEFHDAVLPTRVSRSDTAVVRGE